LAVSEKKGGLARRTLVDHAAALRAKSMPAATIRDVGTVRNFVCDEAVDHQAVMALMKRSPKSTANCAFAMFHSSGGIFHSLSDRFQPLYPLRAFSTSPRSENGCLTWSTPPNQVWVLR
jgi:hypothetical protein